MWVLGHPETGNPKDKIWWILQIIWRIKSDATSLILNSKSTLGGYSQQKWFWFKARGLRDIGTRYLFFNFFWKIKKKNTEVTLSLILRFNLRLEGLLHMEREYIAHHIWSRFRGLSTSQPRSKRKYLKDYSMYLKEGLEATRRRFWLLEELEDALPSTWRLQDSATKSSGACQTRGSGTAYRHSMF